MNAAYFQTWYDYNAWANRRILDTVARLVPAQLRAAGPASFDTIHATLVHTMSAQWIWLSRWQGVSPAALFNPADYPDLPAIRAYWESLEQDTQQFIRALDDPALGRVITYTNIKGLPFAHPLWQLLLHQVNHATQHRSEVAAMLTGFGQSPGALDFVKYLEEMAG